MNFLTLAGLSAVLHAYVALRLLPDLASVASVRLGVACVLLVSALLIPLGLMARRIARAPLADRLGWAGLLCMGLFSTLMVLTLLRDAALGLLWAVDFLVPGRLELAPWRTVSAQAVALLGGLSALLGLLNARRTAAVVRVDVPIPGLPPAWQGFTVAQISDIHVGPTIRQHYVRRIVERVNTLQADLVAVTGDLVDGRVTELAAHVAPLADLRSRHGTFFVTGNHEYYSGAPAWIDELRRLGLTVLLNEHVVIPAVDAAGVAARPLVLAGVTDFNAGHFDPAHRSDPVRALAGAPPDAVRVLLAHQPRSAAAAAEAGFDLQLSGHTHGGQFYPWNLFVRLQQP
ncbi:metallophosphoesterase, partial [Polaromonas sp.]|uniref:metallophosphoesterase n=1 Tax=Polaromonas sp. TaxID=1869339 RepID=UPI0013BE6000